MPGGTKILLVSPVFPPFVSGTSTFLRVMAERLAADGYRVSVLTSCARAASDFWDKPPHAVSALPSQEAPGASDVTRLAIAYPFPAPYAFGLLRRTAFGVHRSGMPANLQRSLLVGLSRWMPPLRDLGVSFERLVPGAGLVHLVDSSWDGLFVGAATAARRQDVPYVAMPLMHLGSEGAGVQFRMPHQVDAYRAAEAVIALSQREAAEYIALGVAPPRVHVLPMGVPSSGGTLPGAEAIARFRQRYAPAGPLVAFIGANTFDKGAFTLLEAVARLNAGGQDMHVVFAGPEGERLRRHLRRQLPGVRQALEGKLSVLGVVDEPAKQCLLAACDMLALPSRADAFGIVLLEAWLHGKPVIGAGAGGIPELVRDGETGLLVPFGDPEALAGAIRRLVEDAPMAARLGAAGREQALQKYTWDHSYRALSQVYESVVAGR